MRLIDADKADERQVAKHDSLNAGDIDRFEALTVLAELNKEPTVDAVQVIRCMDCMNAKPYSTTSGESGLACDVLCCHVLGDFYCANGREKV